MNASSERIREIEAEIAEAQHFVALLESGSVHIGAPFEGRTEAKIFDLKRQIARHQFALMKLTERAPLAS